MVSYGSLLAEVIGEIRPSQKTRTKIERCADEVASEIRRIAERISPGVIVEVHGSVAKGTYLGDRHDIDVFVFFPTETPRESLEKSILRIGESWAKERGAPCRIAYAEHPYVTVTLAEKRTTFEVDVVASYMVDSTSDLLSAVDRTRFHTEYVRGKITPSLRDQILLTKRFMRGIGAYGSEIRVGGFSGLLCEVLTMAHGSFLGLLRSAQTWSPGHTVDIEGLNPKAGEEFDSPLVIVDPTDGRRNAGAAVTIEKFSLFVHASRSFLRAPTRRFFFPRKRRAPSCAHLIKALSRRGTRLLLLEFPKPDVIDDIIYPQLNRMISSLHGQLEERGFSIAGPRSGGVCEDRGRFYVLFELGIHLLPPVEKREGPTIERAEHAARFLEKHARSHPYIEGDRWVVDVPRRFSNAEQLLRQILETNPHGILPSHVAKALGEGWTLRGNEEAIESCTRACRLMMAEHLSPVFPWER